LKVKANPTFIIYKKGIMKWRQSGDLDANTLIGLVEQYG
jgi:thioredoxin 1